MRAGTFWLSTRRRGVQLGVAGFACLALVACGEDEAPKTPEKPAAANVAPVPSAAAATPGPAATTAVPPKQAPSWTYSPVGMRDPFRSYLADLSENKKNEPSKKSEETEKYELDQYRLTGLITGTAQPKAMVEDPKGDGHVLRIGSRLGKNGGVVTRITATGIVVTEEFRAPTGERVRVPITIKLPQPELNLVGE